MYSLCNYWLLPHTGNYTDRNQLPMYTIQSIIIIICIANILLLICISICEGTCQILRHLCRSGQQNLKMFWKRYVLKHGFYSGEGYWDSWYFDEYVLYFPYETLSTFMYIWMVPVNIGSNSFCLPSNLVIIESCTTFKTISTNSCTTISSHNLQCNWFTSKLFYI